MKQKAILFLLTAILCWTSAEACTSFIVSGKVTPDGRPMIFKNRDTGNTNNHVVLVKGERYRFLAVSADNDKNADMIWQGHNERGFAIFDTAAYNLNSGDTESDDHRNDPDWYHHHGEGWIMKHALEICASISDFENMLDTLPRPLGCNGNLAVMDADGGVAYYEVSNKGYVKFDANDPNVAPYGYLIRTNHGYSGDRTLDSGIERYLAIDRIMLDAGFTGNLSAEYLFNHVPRNFRHGLTGIDIMELQPEDGSQLKMFPFRDFIPRYVTASASLIQGVKKGEDPLHTVSYTIIGNTMATVCIPLLITPEGKLPQAVIGTGEENHSTLCQKGQELKKVLFPYDRGNGHDYINIAALANKAGTGILQQILPIEKEILQRGKPIVESVRDSDKPDYKALYDYYDWVDQYIDEQYSAKFGI